MENASKALLIAASVLIAIALIAVGIRILSSTKGTTEQVDKVATGLEISMFNSQFERYEGKQASSQVQELLRFAKRTNAKGGHTISFRVRHGGGIVENSTPENVLTNNNFNNIGLTEVTIIGYDDNGYINSIELYNEDFDND